MRAIDLFAGIGGIDLGAVRLGWDVDGWENMDAAVATRSAAGLKTAGTDVRDADPRPGEYDAVLGGPPCQPFSTTGDGAGRTLLTAITNAVRNWTPGASYHVPDERSALVLEPLRIVLTARPTFVVLEQVPTVLPVWKAYAERLEREGYTAVAGVLSAEEFGVPQTRKRAFLVARRDGGIARLPIPTHEPHGREVFGLQSTRSMRDALGWPISAYTVSNYGTGGDPRKRGIRYAWEPAATVTSKANRVYVVDPLAGTRRRVRLDEALRLQTFPADFPVQGKVGEQFLEVGNAVPVDLAYRVLQAATR